MKTTKQSEMEARIEALEAQLKALVDIFKALFPEAVIVEEADPYSAGFVKFRARAEAHSRVLR